MPVYLSLIIRVYFLYTCCIYLHFEHIILIYCVLEYWKNRNFISSIEWSGSLAGNFHSRLTQIITNKSRIIYGTLSVNL